MIESVKNFMAKFRYMLQMRSNLIVCVLILTISSCKSVDENKLPPCYQQPSAKTQLRWGVYNQRTNRVIEAHMLDAKAQLFQIDSLDDKNPIKLGRLDDDLYCNAMEAFRKELLNTQALAAFPDTIRFFSFVDPSKDLTINVFWDPKYQTEGSRGFRILYEQFITFPKRFEKK